MSYDCSCNYDPPDFYTTKFRKARKEHTCYECSGRISAGETYEYTSGSWERRPDSFKTCERCHDLRQWVTNNLPCYCWAHGSMLDDAAEAVQDALWRAPEETKGVRFGFLRRRIMLDRHNQRRSRYARFNQREQTLPPNE